MTTDLVPAIVKTVTVPLAREASFELFTRRIGDWWPLATHSVGQAGSRGVALTSDAVVETLADGTTTQWAEITRCEPPELLELSWHPGSQAGPRSTQVTVTFTSVGEGTEVRLEHRGWERTDPARAGYSEGWDVVLAALVAAA